MKLMLGMLSLLWATSVAAAQPVEEVQLSVGGFTLASNGAEKAAGVWFSTGTITLGKPAVGVFSVRGCGYFTATVPPNSFEQDATAGWRVEVTPTMVVNHAVTFRLRWFRALDKGNGLTPATEDVEVTLRPGESRPLDSVQIVQSGLRTRDGRPCNTKAVSLRVLADFPDFDRRLIGADVWLVERLRDGKEESQLQSIRGVPHRPIAFYFDGIADGTKRLDIVGNLVADPQPGSLAITLETVRAEAHPQQAGYQSVRWFRSTLRMKPDEIVEVTLTQPDDKSREGRAFSIRIRAKQIR